MDSFVETADGWAFSPTGARVTRLCVDRGLLLYIASNDAMLEVRLNGPFCFDNAEDRLDIDPDDDVALAPVLSLSRAVAVDLRVSQEGCLVITFGEGRVISVPASDDYEAWWVTGPGDVRFVSDPGGGVTAWL